MKVYAITATTTDTYEPFTLLAICASQDVSECQLPLVSWKVLGRGGGIVYGTDGHTFYRIREWTLIEGTPGAQQIVGASP